MEKFDVGEDEQTIDLVRSYEAVERDESHREATYDLPEDVAEDLGHPTTRRGWLDYWEERLREDIEDIPGKSRMTRANRNVLIQKKAQEQLESDRFLEERTSIMRKFSSRLAEIDQRIDYPEAEQSHRSTVSYDAERDSLYTVGEDGTVHPFHLDNPATDIDWGVMYRPSPDVPKHLWRSIRKHMDIAEARRDIDEVINREIASVEGLSLPTTSISGEWLAEHFNPTNGSIAGIIGERMAKNTLYALGRQDSGENFKIENSNAREDAELKYDFKIVLPTVTRGVATVPEGMEREEDVAGKRSVGVQFTISNARYILDKKEGQLKIARDRLKDEDAKKYIKRPVNDIVLVNLGLKASERYAQWLDEGMPPGGPEQYITDEEKQELLAKITAGLHSEG